MGVLKKVGIGIAVVFAALIVLGIIGATFTQIGRLAETTEVQTPTSKFQLTNKLDPNILVSSEPENVLLKQEELASRWLEKNSWGDYKFKARYENGSGENFKSASMGMEKDRGMFGLSINVQKYNSIENANKRYTEILNEVRNNPRVEKQEVTEVGNERFGALAHNQLGCGWYKIVFRRNNMLVTILTSESYSYKCPSNEIKEEIQYYSIIIDNKIS